MNYHSSAKNRIYIYGFWRAAPQDIIFAQRINYRVAACEKITSIRNSIAYLKERIADPELDQSIKDSYFIPTLERDILSLVIFEKQSSVLAA